MGIPTWTITLVFLVLTSVLLGRLVYLTRPLDNDAAVFIYMGKLASEGAPYWHEFRDNKFPSVGLVMSVMWRTFGIHWPAYVLTGLVLSVGSAMLLARCAARHVRPDAWWPTFLFALVYLNLNIAVFGGFELETVQSFICILAFTAGMEAARGGRALDSFVVGVAAGFAAWLKPTGLGVAGVVWLVLMLNRRTGGLSNQSKVKHTFAMFLGAAIPLGAFLFYLWRTNLLPLMPEIIEETKRYASETPWVWSDLLKPCVVFVVVGFPIAVRGWVMRRHTTDRSAEAFHPVLLAALLWFAIELLGAFMQRRMYSYHFYPVLAPAALVFGYFARKDTAGRFLVMLAPIMLLSVLGAAEVIEYWQPQKHSATQYVRENTSSDDRIWVDCGTRLALETERTLGARFALMFLFSNYDEAPQKYGRILIDDLRERKPELVLLPGRLDRRIAMEAKGWDQLKRSPVRTQRYAQAWHDLQAFVDTHYTCVGWIETDRVYRLK